LRNAAAPPREIAASTAPVTSIALQPSGTLLAAGSLDGSVTLWDTAHPATPVQLHGKDSNHRIRAVAFSHDGKLVAANQFSSALVWNAARPNDAPRSLCGAAADIRSLAFAPDGTALLCGTSSGRIVSSSLRSDRETEFPGRSSINSISFNPRGDTFAAGSADGTIRLWRINQAGALPGILPRQEGWIWAVAFNGDGSGVISAGREPALRISDARTD